MRTKLLKVLVIWIYFNFFLLNSLIYIKAAESIQATNININATNSWDVLLNPWVNFYFEFNWKNNWDSDVSNVKSYIWFEDISANNISSSFSYIPWSLRTRINSVNVNDPIPDESFSTNWFEVSINNISNPLVSSNSTMSVSRKLQFWMTVPQNFPTYSNIMKWYFHWKWTEDIDLYSETISRNIYINVKPHIVDYYFAKDWLPVTSVKSDWVDSVDLYVKVKDYNWCWNIDWWLVTADLNLLWYSTSQDLLYDSCEWDWQTAIFRKTWITTVSSVWEKQFTPNNFTAVDEDWNYADYLDVRFNNDDRKTNLLFNVSTPWAPQVTLINVSDYFIWWPWDLNSTIIFSGSQSWFSKIVLNSDETCSIWTVLSDWTIYTGWDTISYELTSDKLLIGSNAIYLCIKNESEELWTQIVNITKDITSPILTDFSVSPWSVVTWDSNLTFKCSESWFFSSCLLTGESCLSIVDWTQTLSLNSNLNPIPNNMLSYWPNTIIWKCKDNASNISSNTWTVTKIQPTPSMAWKVTSFQDLDFDYPWFDWRDIFISWDNTPWIWFSGFQSRRIFILPENTSLNTSIHSFIWIESDVTKTSWVWTSSIKNDSAWNILQQGITYKIHVWIISSSWLYWEFWTLTYSDFIFDIVTNAKVLLASFVSRTLIELTTDALLDPNLFSHSWSLLTYNIGWNLFQWQSINSVDWTKIRITIPQLDNTFSTWNNLIVLTWALHSSWWWYNNYFSSWTLIIQDKIAPVITWFANSTVPWYWNFYSWNLNLSRDFSEQMSWLNKTYIEFNRVSWALDATLRRHFLNNTSELTLWPKTLVLQLSWMNLTCWTVYNWKIFWTDMNWNTSSSNNINNIWFDNCPPSVPVLNQQATLWTWNTTLTWSASSDDNWNWSWIKYYQFTLYNWTWCNTINTTLNNWNVTSKAISVSDWSYSWSVYSVDNMNNVSQNSVCDDFIVDSTIPVISSSSITDTTLNSSQFTKSWNQLQIKSNIQNTDINNIIFDLTSIVWSSAYSGFVCSQWSLDPNIDCIYDWQVTLSFNAWFAWPITDGNRQVTIKTYNTHGINLQTASVSINVDNTFPVINSWLFTAPIVDSYVWKNYNVTRTPSKIIDSNLSRIKLDYSSWSFTNWINLLSWSNSWLYNRNLTSLQSWNYKLRMIAFDIVWNSTEYVMPYDFVVDVIDPVINTDLLLSPINWQYIKWNTGFNIQWNSWTISDVNINNNRLDIYYSLNNWVDYSVVVTWIQNNWLYNWNIPNLNSQNVKLKFIAYDLAWNSTQHVHSSTFVLDSTNPTLWISYSNFWWTTPPSWSFINSNWFDVSGSSLDTNLFKAYYIIKDTSNNLYRNEQSTSRLWVENWNEICTSNCANFSFVTSPFVNNWANYTLQIKSIDLAWNFTISDLINYTWDNSPPSISIFNLSWSYFKDTINLSWTSFDDLAWLSSVNIDIKKWNEYWDWTNWQNTIQWLAISWTNESWTYNFEPDSSDVDWQIYQLLVNAYDNSYKINNSYSTWITFILDKTPPVINSTNFWTFPTWWIIKGWVSVDIVWNSNNITDSWVWVDYINIDYFDWNSYVSIITGESNDWVFNWEVPQFTDISNSRLRLTAYDKLWSNSSILSNVFAIDSLPPTIDTITTLDLDANWQIDAILVTMSESILDSTIHLSDFFISEWIGVPLSWETWLSANDNKFILKFNNKWDSSTIPLLDYVKWNITDIAWNYLDSTSWIISIDGAAPRILSVFAYDKNQNWKLDQFELKFSENLKSESILTGFVIDNWPEWMALNDIVFSWSIILLNLIESNDFSTATNWLLLSLNNFIYTDPSSNYISNFTNISITDLANPILVSASIYDTNNNFKSDKIELVFSELITWSISTWEFIFSNLSDWSSIISSNFQDNKINFIVQETTNNNDTDVSPNFYYSWLQIVDLNWNLLNNIINTDIIDRISPKLLNRTTQDFNWNWKIDRIKLEFSENLNDNFSSLSSLVNWYMVVWYETDLLNDNIIYVLVDELAYYDWSSLVKIRINSNSTLRDTNWNLFNLEFVDYFATDWVWPVIAWTRFEPGTNLLYITFSEAIDDSSLNISSFIFNNWWTSSIVSIDTWNIPDDENVVLLIIDEQIEYWATQISYSPWTIKDLIWNSQSIQSYSYISASIIINEIMWSNIDSNINQYIELRNLSNVDTDLSWWIIENAWWDSVDLTLPSITISANWYLLIAKEPESLSLLDITPNYIYSQMNLSSSMNDLVLKNWLITNDIARVSFSPLIWDNDTPRAMERVLNPWSWILSSNWYSSQWSLWFDNSIVKWTPWAENIFDSLSPSYEYSFPAQNELIFQNQFNIKIEYKDDIWWVWINTDSFSVQLFKWNWNIFDEITDSWLNQTGIIVNLTNSIVPTNILSFWKYKFVYKISDNAWNESQYELLFYVDQFEFIIENTNIEYKNITANNFLQSEKDTTITIKTLWAWFDIEIIKDNYLSWPSIIPDWNWSSWFWIDLYNNNNWSVIDFDWIYDWLSWSVSFTLPSNINIDWLQNIYLYKINYWLSVDEIQESWSYNTNIEIYWKIKK